MSDINDGVPAFPNRWPEKEHAPAGRDNPVQRGMTLRDYFAVRAPEEIPSWFQHVPETPRPVIPIPYLTLTKEQYNEWDGLGEGLELDDVCQEVRDFNEQYNAAWESSKAWDREFAIGSYFAWRYHYADMMLRARGGA